MAKKRAVDFTNVKEGGSFSPTHMTEGDYLARITKVDDAESKSDGEPMWLFSIQLEDRKSAVYPFYCKLVENQLWKLRNLLIAAGKTVPKKRLNVDPNTLVGVTIGISLEDDEYEGKMRSTIAAVFPASELEEEAPPPAKAEKAAKDGGKAKKGKAKKSSDDDLDELDLEDL